jgi:Subtilase family
MRRLLPILVVLVTCLRAETVNAQSQPSRHLFRQADASAPPPGNAGPELKYRGAGEDRIPDQYIVVLSDDVPPNEVGDVARDLGLNNQFTPTRIWHDAIKAFLAEMSEARAHALSNNPRVKYVEENAQWHASSSPQSQQTNINPVTCDPTVTTCTGVDVVTDNRLWHLDRADQNYADPTNSYSYCTDGTGVTVYVVDMGVNKNHQEFGARVMAGYNATGTATTSDQMPADDPCLGFTVAPGSVYNSQESANYQNELGLSSHGTAVASALGGRRVGIAKNVTIVPIKTSRCDLYSSRVRQSNHFYPENKTMIVAQGSYSYVALYRCIKTNGGTTAPTDPYPEAWPSTAGSTIVDGGVTWLVLDPAVYQNFQSTDMIIDGLNWILSSSNSGPKSNAIVTTSLFERADQIGGHLNGGPTTIEAMIKNLLASNITVIASANNQNGNACDTSPSRMSLNNPDPSIASDVITAGGSMMINRPWTVNLNEPPAMPPSGGTEANGGTKGVEPAYNAMNAVRDARWICGPGDSNPCSNTSPVDTPDPANSSYNSFEGGSNAGPCVTLFAPAKNLFLATTTGTGSDYRDARLLGLASGTSWSAPIVAGFAARILQSNPTYTPAQVRTALLNNCAVNVLDATTLNSVAHSGQPTITNTPNLLLRLGDVNITLQPLTQAAAVSGSTTLSAQAGGTSTVFYQWYQVNSAFDLVSWKNGAHYDSGGVGSVGSSSTAIAGATSNAYQAPAVSIARGYWMRATNSCGSADTDIAIVVPRPGAPGNVVADSNGTTSATITWSSGSGAEKYEVQRKVSGQPWTRVGLLVNAGTFTDTDVNPAAPGGMLVYRVLSVAGTAYLQDGFYATTAGNSDIANINSVNYESLIPGATTLKAQHLIDLRLGVNALCDAVGVGHVYLDSQVLLSSLQGQTVTAADFTSLMSNINAIRQNGAIGMSAASFGVTPSTGAVIAAANLQSLRDALK